MQEIALISMLTARQSPSHKNRKILPLVQNSVPWGPFAILDVSATRDAAGKVVTIAVVNRDREHTQTSTIAIADATIVQKATAYEVNAADLNTSNSFNKPTQVTIQGHQIQTGEQRFSYTFPAHLLTPLRLQLD